MSIGVPKYLWWDYETTGLDPKVELVIEAAAIVTDGQLNRIGPAFSSRIWNGLEDGRPKHMLRLERPENQIALEMHRKNGLLDEFDKALKEYGELKAVMPDPQIVEFDVLDWLKWTVKVENLKELILAGSTVGVFDRQFMKVHMPELESNLSHRCRDVSSDKMLYEDVFGIKFPKAEAHRALADVEESLSHGKVILDQYRRNAGEQA